MPAGDRAALQNAARAAPRHPLVSPLPSSAKNNQAVATALGVARVATPISAGLVDLIILDHNKIRALYDCYSKLGLLLPLETRQLLARQLVAVRGSGAPSQAVIGDERLAWDATASSQDAANKIPIPTTTPTHTQQHKQRPKAHVGARRQGGARALPRGARGARRRRRRPLPRRPRARRAPRGRARGDAGGRPRV